ncbi:MAG TPA: hypothetical protein EYP14_05790, partial [Planctomycetaceae bacterium]|nr:hypothetical protein [Planctomycetaceae bacterium]
MKMGFPGKRPARSFAASGVWLAVTFCSLAADLSDSLAGNWPMARGGPTRDGYTAKPLPEKLVPCWTFHSPYRPQPAWPRSRRMTFDRVFPLVSDGERVFFGSSADHCLYALDARTGKLLWTFVTGGPVRFAPVVWKKHLYVGSDDGFLYCLRAVDGQMRWKRRGGPDGSRVLGNERLISRWPVRGGPVIADGVLYFAAGIWPSEGFFLYALDPTKGDIVWKNDRCGSIHMPQPHGGAEAESGVTAQGGLAVAG